MPKTRTILVLICCFTTTYTIKSQVVQEQLRQRLAYLVKDSTLLSQVSITENTVSMYAPGTSVPEIVVDLKMAEEYVASFEALHDTERLGYYLDYKNIYTDTPANHFYTDTFLLKRKLQHAAKPWFTYMQYYEGKDVKKFIVLDPGHWAANFTEAQWEKKYLQFSGTQFGRKEDIKFHESDLAWKTAYILKDLLEKDGHIVLITRNRGKSCTGDTYSEWYDKRRFQCLDSALSLGLIDTASHLKFKTYTKNQLARSFFNTWEFYKRSSYINNINPDLVLVMHYNVDEKNKPDKNGNFGLHDHNYSMVFIPGSYAKGELNTPEDRMKFLYFLLSNRLEESAEFSRHIQQALTDSLRIPAVEQESTLSYLQNYSLLYENIPGIYCRNLYLTQNIFSPIAFAEPLLQDNREEAARLSQDDCMYHGMALPCRLIEVAEAYLYGVRKYLSDK